MTLAYNQCFDGPIHANSYETYTWLQLNLNFADAYMYLFFLRQGIWNFRMDQSDYDAFHDQQKDSLQCQTIFAASYIR